MGDNPYEGHDDELMIGEIRLPNGHAHLLTPEEVARYLAEDDETVDFAEWDETLHPRDDQGRFISKDDLEAAAHDEGKADELRARTNDPEERAKLEAAISDDDEPDGSGLEGSVAAAKPGHDPRIPPPGQSITRVWHGDTYKVYVTDDGFKLITAPPHHYHLIDNEERATLTELAKLITGAKSINGVVWFGLGKKGKGKKKGDKAKPKGGTKGKGDKSAGVWAKPAKKLPPPDEAKMAEAGFRVRKGGGWESKQMQLTGPRAREVLQVMIEHPNAMTDPDDADAALEKLNIRFGSPIGKPGTKTKQSAADKATIRNARFGAVAAFARLRSLGMDRYVNTMVARNKSSKVNGWFSIHRPDRIQIAAKHTKGPISSLGKKTTDPGHSAWTWGNGSYASTAIHETGHLLHNGNEPKRFLGWCMKGFKNDKYDGKFDWALSELGDLSQSTLRSGYAAKEISRYGSANALEFVAETFTRRSHGWPVSEAVMAVYRKLGGVELPGWEA